MFSIYLYKWNILNIVVHYDTGKFEHRQEVVRSYDENCHITYINVRSRLREGCAYI